MSCVAVIDVETTGKFPQRHDHIVELAALVIRPDGTVLREFSTLVNPERDIGPTSIHGIDSRDVVNAPRFGEVAGALREVLDGCVAIAGHEVRFDRSFLAVEFERLDHAFPKGPALCTRRLAGGGSLTCACSDYGVPFEGTAHEALADAHATARLLATLLQDAPRLASKVVRQPPIAWPEIPAQPVVLLARSASRATATMAPDYIQTLLSRMPPEIPQDEGDTGLVEYAAILDRVLEDRYVDDEEKLALAELAEQWGLSGDQIRSAHWEYMVRLGEAVLADEIVTDAERRELEHVASLLGIRAEDVDKALETARERLADAQTNPPEDNSPLKREDFAGKRVCFTGESRCTLDGEFLTRQFAAELVEREGMTMAESVTKELDILVVADPYTQSGKAKKAQRYGIRIIHEPVFWRALGLEVG